MAGNPAIHPAALLLALLISTNVGLAPTAAQLIARMRVCGHTGPHGAPGGAGHGSCMADSGGKYIYVLLTTGT